MDNDDTLETFINVTYSVYFPVPIKTIVWYFPQKYIGHCGGRTHDIRVISTTL